MSNICPTGGVYSEEHRWNCLARTVCRMPTMEDRQRFIALFGKKNGLKLRLQLETLVKEQWNILIEERNNVRA